MDELETTCYYEDFLSIDQKDEMYKLNDDGLIWWVDDDGFIDRICIMTERNCWVVLDWLLEMVNQSK